MFGLTRFLPPPEEQPISAETARPSLPVQRPRAWQRRILRHRRIVLAGLGFAITVLTLSQIHPMGSPTTRIVVASHDLAVGSVLTQGDLLVKEVSRDSLPADALNQTASLIHHPIVTAMFGGDVIRQRDVLDTHLINQIGQGFVAIPVHVTPAAAAVVQRGDHVDVLAANPNGSAQSIAAVASDVLVLIPSLNSATTSVMGASSGASGADVVVIARSAQAAAIASANSQATLVLALRGG